MAEIPRTSFGETLFDPVTLVDYVRTQFESAYKKEQAMDSNETPFANGSFYQQIPIPGIDQHELVRESTRIVMKKPFSTLVLSHPEEFAEIYAVYLRGEDGHVTGDTAGYFADQYLIRQYENGRYTSFELITEEGVFDAELDGFDQTTGFGSIESVRAQTLEEQLRDTFKPVERAHELHGILSTYNIVAIND